MHSEIIFSPVDRIHIKGIFELLVDNQNWEKIGMKELPTLKEHTHYWEKIYPHSNKKEFVATYDGQVIGVVGLEFSPQSKEAYLWIFTAARVASQGVASKLLSESEKYLINIDFSRIYTAVVQENYRSMNLFKRNNFILCKTKKMSLINILSVVQIKINPYKTHLYTLFMIIPYFISHNKMNRKSRYVVILILKFS